MALGGAWPSAVRCRAVRWAVRGAAVPGGWAVLETRQPHL